MAKNIEINIKTSTGGYETLYPSVNPEILKLNSGNVNIDNSISEKLGLSDGSTINDVLGKMESGVYLENQPYTNYDLFSNNTDLGEYQQIIDNVAYLCKGTSTSIDDTNYYYAQIFTKNLKTGESYQTEKFQMNWGGAIEYNYFISYLPFVKAGDRICCFCSTEFYYYTLDNGVTWIKETPTLVKTVTSFLALIPQERSRIFYKDGKILFVNNSGRFVSLFINENICRISDSYSYNSEVVYFNNYIYVILIGGSSSKRYYYAYRCLFDNVLSSGWTWENSATVLTSSSTSSFVYFNVIDDTLYFSNNIGGYYIKANQTEWTIKNTLKNCVALYYINNLYYFWGYATPGSASSPTYSNMSIYDSSFNLLSTLKSNTDFIYINYDELNEVFYYFTYQNHNLLQTNFIKLYTQYLTDVVSKQLSIPASQIVGGTGIKFEQGTYTGTGGKTVTLTFVNEPDYIFVYYGKESSSNSSYDKISAFLKKGINSAISIIYSSNGHSDLTLTWKNTTVSWTNSDGGYPALNYSKCVYYYIGIYNVN